MIPDLLLFCQTLGTCGELSQKTADRREEFVCHLYSFREKDINTMCYKIFTKKNKRKKRVVELSVLPHCNPGLCYYTLRVNTVSMIWKSAVHQNVILQYFKVYG